MSFYLTNLERWSNFLDNEHLSLDRLTSNDQVKILKLVDILAKVEGPKRSPYKLRLESRRKLVLAAMEAGIDLAAIKYKGKMAMSRGLLDMWNTTYKERYGSTFGTSGNKESIRRDIKIKLSKKNENDNSI